MKLPEVYRVLRRHFGHQRWWPGDTPFEIMIGAILTQNTAWSNVEKAIQNLKRSRALRPEAIMKMPAPRLAALIRPAGYFNIKTKRIRNFVEFYLRQFDGKIKKMRTANAAVLRLKLLAVNGVGRETADSILLYAIGKTVFVIDAYTKRIFARHRIGWALDKKIISMTPSNAYARDYDEWQRLFHRNIRRNSNLFNDFHAQIVATGKNFCRARNPKCAECPLRVYL